MTSLLSVPVFVSGPDDQLATVDLYNATGTLINEIRDISETFKADALAGLTGGNTLLGDVKTDIIKGFDEATAGIQMDTDSLVKGLIATNPGMVSALRSLPSVMQGELTKVKGLVDIAGTFNGIKAQITKASLSTINGLGSLINGISGANFPFNFTDKQGLAQFSASLIIQATKVGIPGVFKAFVAQITDKKVLRGIVGSVASQAITNSMSELLNDVATSPAGRIMAKVTGGLALRYIRDYTNPNKSSTLQKYEKYQVTRNALDAVLDEWINYYRPGGGAYEGTFMTKASSDFIAAVLIAAKFQTKWIIPTNPGLINTAAGTSAEAYIALITRNLNMTAKNALRQDFPLVYLK
jgi:hypothetical protein